MSSRVGTAIPASRSTALSSSDVGLTRSIQTALSGSAARSAATAFFSEKSEGTNTENIGKLRKRAVNAPKGLSSILASAHDGINRRSTIMAAKWQPGGAGPAILADPPKKAAGRAKLCGKKATG